MAILFISLAGFGLYLGVIGILTDFEDPLHQVGGLFFLVLAFMSAALGVGLWNLEEDARRAAMAFFGLPSALGLIGGIFAAHYESPTVQDLMVGMGFLLLIASPVVYLMRPRVKAAFDQLVCIDLG